MGGLSRRLKVASDFTLSDSNCRAPEAAEQQGRSIGARARAGVGGVGVGGVV